MKHKWKKLVLQNNSKEDILLDLYKFREELNFNIFFSVFPCVSW